MSKPSSPYSEGDRSGAGDSLSLQNTSPSTLHLAASLAGDDLALALGVDLGSDTVIARKPVEAFEPSGRVETGVAAEDTRSIHSATGNGTARPATNPSTPTKATNAPQSTAMASSTSVTKSAAPKQLMMPTAMLHNIVAVLNRSLLHFVNYLLLLTIFFWIGMYKNINVMYHRFLLKVLLLTYYPNKLPSVIREDIAGLGKMPKRVAVILDLKDLRDENGGVDGLTNNVSELVAWLMLAGIAQLTVYEYTGALNSRHNLTQLMRHINKNLANYFGSDHVPSYSIHVPHNNITTHSDLAPGRKDLAITLLSRMDGKPTIVELTKTMSELAQNNELSVQDISVDLIDEELLELVGPEPDLLISFGPNLDLQDYPPWHIRLSEIYWEPDNKEMSYAVFLRALRKFASCKVNVGK